MSLVSIIIPYFKKKSHKTDYKFNLKSEIQKFEILIIYDDSNLMN